MEEMQEMQGKERETFKARLTQALSRQDMKAAALSRATGLSKARISQYVNGVYRPNAKALCLLASALDVSERWLMGEDVPMERSGQESAGQKPSSQEPSPTTAASTAEGAAPPAAPFPLPSNLSPLHLRQYPVLGEIACGSPIIADEDSEGGYVTAADAHADFCLTARGDSMVGARIRDGDAVFIQQTDMVENGEIAAVIVDNEATLKRLYYYPEEQKLVLKPENPSYTPLVFCGEELNHIHILGRAVAMQCKLR
jgi:repressor LexA